MDREAPAAVVFNRNVDPQAQVDRLDGLGGGCYFT
jgi:hypothetical protein